MTANKPKPTLKTTSRTDHTSLRKLAAVAQQLAAQGQFGESAAAIERLFAVAEPQDKLSPRLLEAREAFCVCQRALVEQNHPAARQAAADLRAETEKLCGCPVRISYEDDSGLQLAWEHRRKHHVVLCPEEPENLQSYEISSALLRLQAEIEALRAGKSRFPTSSWRQIDELISRLDAEAAKRLAADGGDWITCNANPDEIALVPLRLLFGSAPYMLVDAQLRRRFPMLRPAQFLTRSTVFLEGWRAREDRTEILPTLKLRARIITALEGLNALFLDALFGGVTDFAARYHDLDGFDLAEKLWAHWESRFPAMQPGDEFGVIDEFAEILELSGHFDWIAHPSKKRRQRP